MDKLNLQAWFGLLSLALVMSLVLFITAGTIQYWQAWGYLAVFFGSSSLITIYLMKKDPALLKRRLRGGPAAEKEKTQKVIMLFTFIGFLALLAMPALDYRFGWSSVPLYVVIAGDFMVGVGFFIIFLVYRENPFASAIIEISEDQKVISSGPYALVRHPMYAGSLLYLGGTPLGLGSYWGFVALAATLPFFIWRLVDEERFLSARLPGYAKYCAKVRWRLIPGVF
ncbi:MAG: hypothetical protein CXZ00_11245 [Acidobacteria bacterium]|nr:MAG: hypothetical protein CXZ00_11245 [Acidobacteriota bacterium]